MKWVKFNFTKKCENAANEIKTGVANRTDYSKNSKYNSGFKVWNSKFPWTPVSYFISF